MASDNVAIPPVALCSSAPSKGRKPRAPRARPRPPAHAPPTAAVGWEKQ